MIRTSSNSATDSSWRGVSLALTAFVSGRARGRALDVEPSLGTFGGLFYASGFTVWNAGASYRLPRVGELFGRIENLFDRTYEEALGFPALGEDMDVWGAVLAVFVLQSGVKGLQLAGVGTTWIESLFFGIALVVAVGFSSFRRRVHGGQRRWWRREESGPEYFLGRLMGWGTPKTEQSKQNANEWWYDPADREGHHLKP